MNTSGRRLRVLVACAATLASAVFAPAAARAEESPPNVARLSLVRGSVAVQHAGSTVSLAAAINAPVLSGDYLSSGADGRAEVQFDGTSSVRIAQNVQMRFVSLEPAHRELQLAQGTLDLRLFRDAAGNRIDTPSVSVVLEHAGSYRVGVSAEGRSEITVRSGRASVTTPGGSFVLVPGKTMLVRGPAANPSIEFATAIALDDFDRFNDARDSESERALASSYVDPTISGGGDLSAYGRWISAPGYGTVWMPNATGPGWAPYRDGSWTSLPYYGWSWVGAEPWGWAPYHYGRWFYNGPAGWCWYPGAFSAWQPALVAFIGLGGFGNIGWFPLGPYDPFYPWWGYGPAVIVNTYTTVVNYQNGRIPNVVTKTPVRRFLLGDSGGGVPPARNEIRGATVVHGRLPFDAAGLTPRNHPAKPAVTVRTEMIQQRFAAPRDPASSNAFAPTARTTTWGRFDGSRAVAVPAGAQVPPAAMTPRHAQPVAPPAYQPAAAPMAARNAAPPPAPAAPAQPATSSQTTMRPR